MNHKFNTNLIKITSYGSHNVNLAGKETKK